MAAASAGEIEWARAGCHVRSGTGKPCASDRWNNQGAWVDAEGGLHLRLSRMPDGQFACVEVESAKRFGFGRYAFEIRGPIGDADPDVVFGVFMYPPAEVGPDGTNEIDIEIARWGDASAPQVNYTVWNRSHPGNRHAVLRVPDNAVQSSFAFTWQPGVVSWESPLQNGREVVVRGDVADRPQTLVINLWLYRRPEPRSGKEVEFIIKSLGP
ncbi:hypothetical protein CA602_15345 [Paraburkholderia hospita]|nr:hypothetical protein CA602_15345 [Paraburkholderia hospita]